MNINVRLIDSYLSTLNNIIRTCIIFCVGFVAFRSANIWAQQAIEDPIPGRITKSGVSIDLIDFVQIPASSGSVPLARINLLKTSHDGSGRLFVNDLRGKLYVIHDGNVNVYLDLEAENPNFIDQPGLGTGFGSFAFHPEFATNGNFYTTHAEASGSGLADLAGPAQSSARLQGVIMEWTASDPDANIFSGGKRELLRIDIAGTIHGLQDMAFNPNVNPGDADYGNLYVCVGDGGSVEKGIPNNSHRLDSILGTIIRIDPFGTESRNGQYGIPADNPFAADNDALNEIWAWGFRNPHRISWDAGGDGLMFIGEIGQHNVEEVNIGIAGADYGWNQREGTFAFNPYGDLFEVFPSPANDASFGYTYPVAQFDHDEGHAIVGGFVYRGLNVPNLFGKYLFGDIVTGRLFYIDVDSIAEMGQTKIHELTIFYDGEETTLLEIVGNSRTDLRFGIDDEGELYILTKIDGNIRKVIGSAPGIVVWPGDTNNDGIVNQADVLPLGLYWIQTGPPRVNGSCNWFGQPATPWSILAATSADANGGGIVDQADVLCIGINWGKTHTATVLSKANAALPEFQNAFQGPNLDISINGDTDPGQIFSIEILANDVTNLFGLSFEFVYSPISFIEPLSVEPGSGNLLGDDLVFVRNIDLDAGKVSIGLTRKAGQGGLNGSGLISTITVKMSDTAITGQATTWLSIENVQAVDPDGNAIQFDLNNVTLVPLVTEVEPSVITTPDNFALHQNYPNPFNPSTTIAYQLPKTNRVTLKIYNLAGQEIRTLFDQIKPPENFSVQWDGKDSKGEQVASGVYIYQLKAEGFIAQKKLLLLR